MRVRPSSKVLSVTRRCNLFKPAAAAREIILPPPAQVPVRIQNIPTLFLPKNKGEKLLRLLSYADLSIGDERQNIVHRKD